MAASAQTPFFETSATDRPLTLYAATKKATEVMAHSYAHLWSLPTTMFRFFTVYGPWGRPDMAPFKFLEAIEAGRPIDVYNHGDMQRDFTYIDDLVEAIVRLVDCVPAAANAGAMPRFRRTRRSASSISGAARRSISWISSPRSRRRPGKTAIRNYLPMQKGDVPLTFANCALLERLTGYRPETRSRPASRRWSRGIAAITGERVRLVAEPRSFG